MSYKKSVMTLHLFYHTIYASDLHKCKSCVPSRTVMERLRTMINSDEQYNSQRTRREVSPLTMSISINKSLWECIANTMKTAYDKACRRNPVCSMCSPTFAVVSPAPIPAPTPCAEVSESVEDIGQTTVPTRMINDTILLSMRELAARDGRIKLKRPPTRNRMNRSYKV